jgi:hypothetical protein
MAEVTGPSRVPFHLDRSVIRDHCAEFYGIFAAYSLPDTPCAAECGRRVQLRHRHLPLSAIEDNANDRSRLLNNASICRSGKARWATVSKFDAATVYLAPAFISVTQRLIKICGCTGNDRTLTRDFSARVFPALAQQASIRCNGRSHVDVSRWCLVAAIAALGMKTSFKQVFAVGWRPIGPMITETA